MPQWFYQLGSPRWFFQRTETWITPLAVLAICLLSIGAIWGLAYAPADYQQGNSFRIIYVHVPSALLAQSGYLLMALCAAIGLIWKMKVADMVAKSCVPIGASMAVIALATGAIWGKPTWGAWWVWDARLTSMLVLLCLYVGVYVLRQAFANPVTGDRIASILTLIGVVNIPIIQYSVEWWATLHQPSTFTLTKAPAMPIEMWLPLLLMVIGFYLLFAWLVLLRTRLEILQRETRASWVQQWLGARL